MCKRSRSQLLTGPVALLIGATFAHSIAAQSFERLPPTTFPFAQFERLPGADDRPGQDGPEANARDPLQFAGGSVELQVPEGWWAQEVPFGREIRLVLAPQAPTNLRRAPIDGMWIAYHTAPAPESHDEAALSRELLERLRSVTENRGQYSPPTSFQFGRWPAVVAEFTTSDAATVNSPITGRHVLVRTEWGVFEFHASAPDAIVASRSDTWTTTWDRLRLKPPATPDRSVQIDLSESNSIVGDWKAFRSRMRFTSDGRVVIVPDVTANNRTPKPLAGTFEARDDLIFVRWDDGSRLNLRWRLQGTDLFLTDHEGQVSRLKRVFN